MDRTEVIPIPLGSDSLDRVWNLYRKNASTLGFLPRGALDEFAGAGSVLGAVNSGELLGYVAWRRSRGDVVVVHLCVAEPHRGSACAEMLLSALIEACKSDAAIRLSCRKDYGAANSLWPKHGFTFEAETVGRGSDAEPLYLWRRRGRHDAPLLKEIKEVATRASQIVAIDANVFYDMMQPGSIHHEESSSLLSRWVDSVEVCVTPELRNEISRRGDVQSREIALAFIRKFDYVECEADELPAAVQAIEAVLPSSFSASDHSDRRQLAHAWRGGASIFASRDRDLLDHAGELHSLTGVLVLRPSDALTRLQGNEAGKEYAPVRLQGTSVEVRTLVSEDELHPFQNYAKSETKAEWLSAIRSALSQPNNVEIALLGLRGEMPRVAVALDQSEASRTHVRFLRSLSGRLTGTLLRRLLANTIESAKNEGRSRVTVDGRINNEVARALHELGFERLSDGTFVRYMVRAVIEWRDSLELLKEVVDQAPTKLGGSAEELEERFWPLKLLGAGIPAFIVPIREAWAAALFDPELANRDLFEVPEKPALALENVYYSASNISIPACSRILWYVSGKVNELRAVSVCLATDHDSATNLSRRYHRLGAYRWRDVLGSAKGQPDAKLRAYRFARTELATRPIGWKRLTELMCELTGKTQQIQSPVRVPEHLFTRIYKEAMGMDK